MEQPVSNTAIESPTLATVTKGPVINTTVKVVPESKEGVCNASGKCYAVTLDFVTHHKPNGLPPDRLTSLSSSQAFSASTKASETAFCTSCVNA